MGQKLGQWAKKKQTCSEYETEIIRKIYGLIKE